MRYVPLVISGVLVVSFSIEHVIALLEGQGSESVMALTILCVTFFGLLVLGVPVAFAIGLSAMCTILYEGLPLAVLFQQMMSGMNVFSFLAIPFFVFSGELMLHGGDRRQDRAARAEPGRPRARRPGHVQRGGVHAVRRRVRARPWPTSRPWAR